MSYDTFAHVVKMGGTLVFSLFFFVVIIYAIWPKNKARFDRAAQLPLTEDDFPKI